MVPHQRRNMPEARSTEAGWELQPRFPVSLGHLPPSPHLSHPPSSLGREITNPLGPSWEPVMGPGVGPLEAAGRNDKAHTCLVRELAQPSEVCTKLNIFNLKGCPLA